MPWIELSGCDSFGNEAKAHFYSCYQSEDLTAFSDFILTKFCFEFVVHVLEFVDLFNLREVCVYCRDRQTSSLAEAG